MPFWLSLSSEVRCFYHSVFCPSINHTFTGVVSVPLGIEYDKTQGLTQAEQANMQRLGAAAIEGMTELKAI